MTNPRHPTETELMIGDAASTAHAAGCPRCARVASGIGPALPPVDLRSARVSPAVLGFMHDHAPAGQVRRGDVWRAEWDGVAAVVVCAGADGSAVDTLPVDLVDPQPDDPGYFPADATVLGCAFSVATGDPVRVPRFMLDRRLDHVPVPGTWVTTDLDDTWGVDRARLRLRQVVEDATVRSGEETSSVGALPDLLKNRGITRSDLVAAGLTARAASLVLQGRTAPTVDQLGAIAGLVGVPAPELANLAGGFPGRLLAVLHEPVNRARVERRARLARRPVPLVRRDIGLAIAGTARRTSYRATIDWQAEVDAFFDS